MLKSKFSDINALMWSLKSSISEISSSDIEESVFGFVAFNED
jgi:hypothetical protein